MKIKFLFITLFVLFVSPSFVQTKPTPEPPPGNIKLLPGYVHKDGRHTDTYDGTISKENGLSIYYDIGRLAGNYATFAYSKEKENLLWVKTIKFSSDDLMIVYLKDGRIYATYGEWTNFIATVKTNEELADFLIMIMTYNSDGEPTDKKPKKQK